VLKASGVARHCICAHRGCTVLALANAKSCCGHLNNNLSFLASHVATSQSEDVVTRIDSAIAAYPAALSQWDSKSRFPLLSFLCQIALRSYAELIGNTVPLSAERERR
jgi:hypothetical protein